MQRTYVVSANLIQLWLTQFDRGELNDEEAEVSVLAEYEAHIVALKRKVGQLTMDRHVAHELQQRGHLVNHKRVARVMRAKGMGIKPRRHYVRTTDSNHDLPIYPSNLIPPLPDMMWVADFTYSRIAAGFCYLAVILDGCNRKA
ncbi:IS3 family transposase [Phyllobacterium endophyticum]|uniref:IS3 family transposase n=1 Tax=Phyllobacterium endophyticum TaxID=1149773 RepID=UPI0017BC1933|nr:hypothetical protein [Phyllobacterium endophyticum]MBB3237108.1 transposase InsO family protein [Phyllobacterium endophyticum]